MRTMIFGKGQLGRDLLHVFSRAGETRAYDLPETDITNEASIAALAEEFAPGLIINAAAFTDVEGAEDALEAAFRVNETGARNLADVAATHQIPVVYYSTDFVFDGTATKPYEPDAPTNPLSVYGRSKLAGEKATRHENPYHFILRTAWLYGPGGNNFVEKMLALGARLPALRVVDDEIGSPTHTLDLAEATLALAQTKAYGTFHAVNAGAVSRYEFARKIFELAGLDTPITPCRAAEFPSKAQRPAYSVLNTRALQSACGYSMRPWEAALEDYMGRRS